MSLGHIILTGGGGGGTVAGFSIKVKTCGFHANFSVDKKTCCYELVYALTITIRSARTCNQTAFIVLSGEGVDFWF